jgi:hypothetical protein
MRTDGRTTGLLLACGAIGPPIFIAAAALEGATRPGYDPIRLPISLLALGELGWTQVVNFLVFGVLMLAFALGLSRARRPIDHASRWGPTLIALFGAGVLAAGIFAADPGGGYPPGAPSGGSLNGTLHDLASLVAFTSLPAACVVFARWFASLGARTWAMYSLVTGVVVVVGFALEIVAFNSRNEISQVAGLIQRVVVTIGWAWLTLLALRVLRGLDGGA